MSDQPPRNVLITDDHPLFINGIRPIVEEMEWVNEVFEANDGFECMEQMRKHNIHLVLLDINMPGKDGFECIREINAEWPETKVVALSQFGERQIVRKMFRLGAHGYLLKSAHEQDIVLGLEDVMFRQKMIVSAELNQSVPPIPKIQSVDLPPRELEVLKLICDQLTAQQIAEKLSISKNTVDNHRVRLMDKAQVHTIAGLVRWAYENGIM